MNNLCAITVQCGPGLPKNPSLEHAWQDSNLQPSVP